MFGPPPPQVCPGGHVPHASTAAQPSKSCPQSAPCALHVVATHPQRFAVPAPPQLAGASHFPQNAVPQASWMLPQVAFACAQAFAGQATPVSTPASGRSGIVRPVRPHATLVR